MATSRRRCDPPPPATAVAPGRTSHHAGFAPSPSVAQGGPCLAGAVPTGGTAAASRPSSRGFSSLPPSGHGCGGDTCNPPTLTHRSRLHPPGQARPSRLSDFRSFLPGCFLHAVHRVHASGRPPRDRAALAPPRAPWPPPPSPPHHPHPTGQVLSLLEIKVHSLWCRGAAAAASCLVSGLWPGRGVVVTQWGPPACLVPPDPSPAGSC